jgi:hypothetical protein
MIEDFGKKCAGIGDRHIASSQLQFNYEWANLMIP